MADTSASRDIAYLSWSDYVGITRCRGVPAADLPKRMAKGLGWAVAGQALTPFDDIADNPWGPMLEVRQTPQPQTAVRLDFWPGTPPFHMLLCDSNTNDGKNWECCTRGFMKAALADFEAETGLRFQAAFEHEFLLTGQGLPRPACFSLEAMRVIAPVLGELAAALSAAGLEPQTIEPEYGVNQYEVSTAPAIGTMSGDRAILVREVIREVARRNGLRACFSPKPAPQAVGNGAHVHFSFLDAAGRNASFDPDGPAEAAALAQHFVAGLVRHLPAICALVAPSPASYYRLGPHHWSCGYASFGVQNREAAVRICPAPEAELEKRRSGFNMELRAPDATASPYMVIGALVRAGLDGIRNRWPLPQAADRDPSDLTPAQRRKLGIRPLPSSLGEALDIMEADKTVQSWMSPLFLSSYIAVKRKELAMMEGLSAEEICARYRDVY